jgi:hypothetical protein
MKTKNVANVRVGEPDVSPVASAHVPGVFQGRHARNTDGARRSTGIRPSAHEPIDPRMPKLSPA